MRRIVSILLMGVGMVVGILAQAQNKIDEQRMERDIEVAENVLSTLIKQQLGKGRNFMVYEVTGKYTPGYGVTFRLPMDFGGPMMYMISDDGGSSMTINSMGKSYSYAYSNSDERPEAPETPEPAEECDNCPKVKAKTKVTAKGTSRKKKLPNDSLVNAANQKIIEASKDFIVDYGDLIGQLSQDEKIMVTNGNEGQRFWYVAGNIPKRKLITIEGSKADIIQYKQGKITRDQLISKIAVIDTESSVEMNPDLELLASIFNRLYRSDLSQSYYTQENIYFEKLKNYGATFYMQVYSSNESDFKRFSMPTQQLEDIDKPTRDKKVTELYPVFEKDMKESMIDYGRTVKSLKPEELLIFNVQMTRCDGCGIPKTLELSVKAGVLQDFGTGKLTKEAAVSKINVKKGPAQ